MLTDNISVIHKGFYHCHCREVSTMSNNNAQKNLDMIAVFDNFDAFVEKHALAEKYADTLEFLHIDHILISTINRLEKQDNKNKRTVIKEMRKYIRRKYPRFYKGRVFKSFPKKKRIVAFLNYIGLSLFTKIILDFKAQHKHN